MLSVRDAAALQPRHDLEAGRQPVQHTMHQPDAAVFLVRVLPVRDAGNRRTQVRQDPQPERTRSEPDASTSSDLGRPGSKLSASNPTVVPTAPAGQQRQRRMHRMPEPDAVQGVGDAIPGTAHRVEGISEQMLEPVARPIQPRLAADEGQQPRTPLLETL
jgi:hypothetical protein